MSIREECVPVAKGIDRRVAKDRDGKKKTKKIKTAGHLSDRVVV